MNNLISFLILTMALFVMLVFLSRRGPLQRQKTFLALALAGWIAAAGVVVTQEAVHHRVISDQHKTELPSQMIPLPQK